MLFPTQLEPFNVHTPIEPFENPGFACAREPDVTLNIIYLLDYLFYLIPLPE